MLRSTFEQRFRCILEMDDCPSALSSSSKQTLYSFVHPDDLKIVAEAHETAIKYTDSYLFVYRLISSNSHIVNFVQSKFKLFAKNGRPDRIEVNHRILTEIDGESLLEKKNSQKLKNFSFDDTLLLSPRNQHSNQQQQMVVVGQHCPPFQQSDLLDATETETIPTAACSPPAHSKAIFTTIKSKKGKKMGRKSAERTDSEKNGTGSNTAPSLPTELALFPDSSAALFPASSADSTLCLPSSHPQHLPSVSSSTMMPPQSNLKSFASLSAPFHLHGDRSHHSPHPSSHSHPHFPMAHPPPPPPPLPSSDSVLANNSHPSSSLSWQNAVPASATPSHANGTPRLKRTQFTFERYYAETVDLSPYGCYYYCPSASTGTLFPQNLSPIVDFSSAVYPPATGVDYWNSMFAMAANPMASGGDGTECYGGTAQQQQLTSVAPSAFLSSVDPSGPLSLQFQQQLSPAWLNAAGSVFSFAAAASHLWPCSVDFDHSLGSSSFKNDGHSDESLAENGIATEMDDRWRGIMEGMALGGQLHGQYAERWTTTAPNDDKQWHGTGRAQKVGRGEERREKRADGAEDADSFPLVCPAQSTPGGDLLHAPANASTVSNASGFRFLSEMAQTLFG